MNPEVHVPSDSPPLRKHSTVISRQRGEGGGAYPGLILCWIRHCFFWGGGQTDLYVSVSGFSLNRKIIYFIWVVNS